jgi:hypothetical protein
MNALTLRGIVAEELGSLRLHVIGKCGGLGELRKTCWTREAARLRDAALCVSGRKVYIVQARMEGRTRTVTIGNAKVLSRVQAMDVARRVLLRAQTGENPAEERKRLRKVPSYRRLPDLLGTQYRPSGNRPRSTPTATTKRKYLDHAFEGLFIDEIEESPCADLVQQGLPTMAAPARATVASKSCARCSTMPSNGACVPKAANPCALHPQEQGPEVRALPVRSGVQRDWAKCSTGTQNIVIRCTATASIC